MELQRLLCFIVINCLLLIRYTCPGRQCYNPLIVQGTGQTLKITFNDSSSKTFSLNEAIAAESKLKENIETQASFNSAESTSQRFSLNKALTSEPLNKIRKVKSGPFELGKTASLKKRKTGPLKYSSKTSKLSQLFKPQNLRKNLSKKREVYKHDKFDKKYFPLLKNLGLLLDNLLNSEQVDSYDVTKNKYKRHKHKPERRRAVVCKCALQSDSETGESKSYKKATTLAKTPTTEDTPTTASTTDSTLGDISSLRQDKNIPLLLPRNTVGDWRNSNGHSERGSSTLYRSAERDISRNPRNREFYSGIGKNVPISNSDEKNTYGDSRISASGDEYGRGRNRGNTADSNDRETIQYQTDFKKGKSSDGTLRELIYGHSRENKYKTSRNKNESEEFVPKYIRRRPVPKSKVSDFTDHIQSQENNEKSFYDVAFNNTSVKRIADGSCTTSAEDQRVSSRDEGMMSVKDLSDLNQALQKSPNMEAPSVTIIDGYSVARDKNGQNKLTEKKIRIHTK